MRNATGRTVSGTRYEFVISCRFCKWSWIFGASSGGQNLGTIVSEGGLYARAHRKHSRPRCRAANLFIDEHRLISSEPHLTNPPL